MENTFDTLFIGGSHNNLVAAGYLAKAGHRVLVLEKNGFVGGGVVSREVTLPGFKHDLHATGLVMIMANPLIANDELGLFANHGLELIPIDGPMFSSVFDDGTILSTYFEIDRCCEEIARFSQRDAEAYRQFTRRNLNMLKLLKRGMFSPPLGMGAMFKLIADSEDGRFLTRLMLSSAYDVITEHFENSYLRCHLYKWIAEVCVSPDDVGTGIILLFLLGLGHSQRPTIVKGGSQELSEALVRAIQAHGGEVRTNAEAVKFNVSAGRIQSVTLADGETLTAKKAVVSGSPPWLLDKFVDGLDRSRLGPIDGLKHSSHSLLMTHLALNEPPRFSGASDEVNRSFAIECMVNDLDRIRKCFDGYKYGELPELFSGHSICNTQYDPTRAPDGKHTLYYYHYVPCIVKGKRLEDWPEIEQQVSEWTLQGLRRYAPNMTESNIIGRSIESPYAMQRHSPSFKNGDCFGISMVTRQFLGERPTPELAQYRVPGVEGLYLCGPFMHPGGGCIGGGRPVAMRIMMDQQLDLKTAFGAL